ncbi:MAG TPA: Wzz/FepE/Etk N-terminal domain-containing protein [Conexibacter sp.]|jgi:Mrp family chromosome partitioning ATPase
MLPPPTTSTSNAATDSALTPYLRAIRNHKLLIAITVLVALVAAGAWIKVRHSTYQASAEILVTPLAQGSTGPSGLPLLSDSVEPTRTLQTAASIIESPRAAINAATSVRGWTPDAIDTAIDVEPRGDTNVLAITAKTSSPTTAPELANAYMRGALQVRSQALNSQLDATISALNQRLAQLGRGDPPTSASLNQQISQLEAIRSGGDPNFSALQLAVPPGVRLGAPRWLVLALAIFGGVLVGSLAALALDYRNVAVRDEDELTELYPLRVLARVPRLPRAALKTLDDPLTLPARVSEAYRTVQVQLDDGRRSPTTFGRAVLVTSPSVNDGKTTSAIALAVALAAAGHDVILFDFDLRRPAVGERLRVASDITAMTSRNEVPLDEMLSESSHVPGLRVLSVSAHDAELAGILPLGHRLRGLIPQARELADFVVIDTAPLGEVADALPVAALVDDIVLVGRLGNTNRADLLTTRALLEQMGHVPTGYIVIGEKSRGGDVYSSYGLNLNGRRDYPLPVIESSSAHPAGDGEHQRPGADRS